MQSHGETNEAATVPTIQNAKKPMNIDNAHFTECVNFTHDASISRVIDKQRDFHTRKCVKITHSV
jgi:hypothetical protein